MKTDFTYYSQCDNSRGCPLSGLGESPQSTAAEGEEMGSLGQQVATSNHAGLSTYGYNPCVDIDE